MTTEVFDEQLVNDPFIPLRLKLTTGELVDIFDPGSVYIRHNSGYIFGVTRSGSRQVDDFRIVSQPCLAD